MLMDMSFPKFDIYQGKRATNCFKSHINSWCPHFFQEKRFVWCLVWNSPCVTQHHFYPTTCLGSKKIMAKPEAITWVCRNEQLQIMFTTEEFLQVAIESWSEWNLNPRPMNSVHTLNPTELIRHYLYIYIYIYIFIYI